VAERKPVVAYIRGLGASGGYYLGCAASKIVALPTALVGSIGVIYLRPVLEQLLGKAGVDFSCSRGAG
jgi:protease-4